MNEFRVISISTLESKVFNLPSGTLPKKNECPLKKRSILKGKDRLPTLFFRGDLLIFGGIYSLQSPQKTMLFPYQPTIDGRHPKANHPGWFQKPGKSWDFNYPSLNWQPLSHHQQVSLPINDLQGPLDPSIQVSLPTQEAKD